MTIDCSWLLVPLYLPIPRLMTIDVDLGRKATKQTNKSNMFCPLDSGIDYFQTLL